MLLRGIVFITLAAAGAAVARSPEWERAKDLYQRTEYKQALAILTPLPNKDAETLQLIGQSYFMLAEYKKATEVFEKATQAAPDNSQLHHWLGRTYCRRAETSSFITAPGYASKCRSLFEKAIELDGGNYEAIDDLFDYYLEAPGILGGGIQKAAELAKRIAKRDPAQGHYAEALMAVKLKDYQAAEDHLRKAIELAPKQVGRRVDLAKYLASRGRISESDAMFTEAAQIAPNSPAVLFSRAESYIQQQRNLNDARQLLERYLNTQLNPDNPPRSRAEQLLKKIS